MANWLHMRDYVTFKVTDTENKRSLCETKDSTSESGHSLLVTCEASHAGIVNGNARFYRPDRMQDSVHTWLPKGRPGKPVLLRHDHDGDPQGRVMRARYVDLSYELYPTMPAVKNLAFYDSRKTKLNLFESVDWVMRNTKNLKDYRGLGYAELGLNITNPDAIAKVQRDEYATVSVSFRTDQAICSVCHTDWAAEDKCEHADSLGGKVDGKDMFLISGNINNDEVSFVNFPADPWGVVTNKESLNQVADSLRNRIFFMGLPALDRTRILQLNDGLLMTDAVSITGSDIHPAEAPDDEETDMNLDTIRAEINSDGLTKERAFALRTELEDGVAEKGAKRVLTSLNALIKKNKWSDAVVELTKEAVQLRIDSLVADLAALPEADRQAYSDRIESEASVFGLTFTVAATVDATEAPTTPLETPAESVSAISDVVTPEFAPVATDSEDAKAAKKAAGMAAVKCLGDLHSTYMSIADEDLQRYFRYATGSVIELWSAGSMVDYWKTRLSESGSDMLVSRKEFDALTEGFEQAEADLAKSKTSIDALATANQKLLRDQKLTLAKILVLGSGEKLTADQLSAEITSRATRTLVSLQDSVTDLLRKLPGTELIPAATVAADTVKPVSDTAAPLSDDGPPATAPSSEAPREPNVAKITPRYVDNHMTQDARVARYRAHKPKTA